MTAVAETIHTLADLAAWSLPGTALAVVGHPIAHSLSPVIHNAALAELAQTDPRFRDWRYHKFDIAPGDLPAALAAFHRLNFRGLNLTVPHKSLVVDHLAKSDSFVRAAGAANTITYFEDGWHGANTDGYGLTNSLQQELGPVWRGPRSFCSEPAGRAGAQPSSACAPDVPRFGSATAPPPASPRCSQNCSRWPARPTCRASISPSPRPPCPPGPS